MYCNIEAYGEHFDRVDCVSPPLSRRTGQGVGCPASLLHVLPERVHALHQAIHAGGEERQPE